MELGFVEKAFLMGLGLVMLTGPIGTLIVWRRMAYFGETLGHSTLLGATVAYALALNLYVGLFCFCLFIALCILTLSRYKTLALDGILGMLAHTALAAGLILASQLQDVRIDLLGFLQGNILAVTMMDLYLIVGAALLTSVCLYILWPSLIATIVNEELAQVEGVAVTWVNWLQIVLLSVIFALAMKLVGVLLLTSLLIIPAMTARYFAKSPEQMVFGAIIWGNISVVTGLSISFYYDWPTGPAIVVAAAGWFVVCLLLCQDKRVS